MDYDYKELLEKIRQLRKEYSFDRDKQTTFLWEKVVREAIVKEQVGKTAAIKMFIKECQKIIDDIDFLLLNDREQTEQDRKFLFQKQDDYNFFISFFTDAPKRIKSIGARVKQDLGK